MSTQQPEALPALIERFRGLHFDHAPDGWPAVRTREITALLDRITELESQLAQRFDAADVATAAAQGFRDGAASVSSGSEPVVWMARLPSGSEVFARTRDFYPDAAPVYTHPAPTEGMAGWRPISEMRAVVAVAVTMLYDTHPEDVLRVFDLCELEKISTITMLLGSQQVEDIYRSAWDHITAAPGPADGESSV